MEFRGQRLTIRYCQGAEATRTEAMNQIPVHLHATTLAQFTSRRKAFADTGNLRSPEFFNSEGDLPNGKCFWAIKTQTRLRAYGWFSSRHRGVFFISHFAFKRGEKLAKADTNIVVANWRRIEEGGEYD